MNTITLLGLIVGIGMLVDNAVVIMENISRYQNKGYAGRVAAILGSKEVSVAVITATLTSVIVFFPLIFSKPTDFNAILQELGITIAITLLASLLISQTLIPLASAKLLKQKNKPANTPIMDFIRKYYVKALSFNLKRRRIAIFSGLGILACTYYPATQINYSFELAQSSSFVGMQVEMPEANSLEIKEKVIAQIEKVLMPYKESFNADSIYSWWDESYAITRIYMKTGFQNEEAMNKVRKKLPELLPIIPGVEITIQDNTPFWRRNAGKKVAVELMGSDSDTLSKIAEKAMDKIETIPGLFDVYSTSESDKDEVHIQLDRERMATYKVSANEPANLLNMTFREQTVSRYKTNDGEVDIMLMLNQQQAPSLSDVKNTEIITNDKQTVLLSNLSQLYTEKIPGGTPRNDKVTKIYVGARFDSGNKNEYQQKVVAALKTIELPKGYKWGFNFTSKREQKNQNEFVTSFYLSLGLIFAIMAGLFESMRQALALMISLPFALAGAFWTLYLFKIDFDQTAAIALLLLLGVVVNNGIVMIEHINLYRRKGWKRFDAMIQGGQERLRPIIMTALTTLVGLIPIIIHKPSLGGTYYYAMAYVIIGGLLFSTLLTALFLPATICAIEDTGSKFKRFFVKKVG
jgi:HAE1 family hydrophobic/amphiphilic exporter-1